MILKTVFLAYGLPQWASCFDMIFGRSKRHQFEESDPDPFLTVPFDIPYHIIEYVDFFTLSRLLREDWKHPITDAVKPVLMGRLIPGLHETDWFNTMDATRVFQNPVKIRRFFEVIRFLYPDFDAACAHFRLENEAGVSPPMWRFLDALNDKARETLSYFFAADPAQHKEIFESDMHTTSSIFQLEEAMHCTIWHTFDSPNIDTTRDFGFKNPAATEMYMVFPNKIAPKKRKTIYSHITWKILARVGYFEIRPGEMPDGYSRMEISFKDPFTQSMAAGYNLYVDTYIRLFGETMKNTPTKWFLTDEVEGFLPQKTLETFGTPAMQRDE